MQPLRPCPERCQRVWSGPAWHSHPPARRCESPRAVLSVAAVLCSGCPHAVSSCGRGAHAGVSRASAGCVVPGPARCRELPASSALFPPGNGRRSPLPERRPPGAALIHHRDLRPPAPSVSVCLSSPLIAGQSWSVDSAHSFAAEPAGAARYAELTLPSHFGSALLGSSC